MRWIALLFAAVLAAGCRGGGESAGAGATPPPTLEPVHAVAAPAATPVAGGARVRGRVTIDGAAPPRRMRDVTVDREGCGLAAVPDRAMLVDPSTKGVRWAVVTLDAPDRPAPPPVTRTLDHARCELHPYVSVVPPGSRIVVDNADALLHDVHVFLPEGSVSRRLPPGGRAELTLADAGNALVTCDLHYWTRAWVMVSTAQFSAVTDAKGTWEIAGVPPGTWRLTVWHERLGTAVREVVIGENGDLVEDVALTPPPPPRAESTPLPSTAPQPRR